MFQDLEKTRFDTFKGWFYRGDNYACPPDRGLNCSNAMFSVTGVQTRSNFVRNSTGTYGSWPADGMKAPPTGKHFREAFGYVDQFGQPRNKLVSTFEGDLYCYVGAAAPTQLLTTIANWEGKFEAIQWKNRIYFFLIFNTGLASNLYVFDIVSVSARLAGGSPLATGVTLAIAGTAGTMDAGTHLVAVAYETSTGFVTAPSVVASIVVTAVQKISVTAIPVGPAGTVARHLLMTKAIVTYSGNPRAYPLYYKLKISDNTTTTATIDGFDTSLTRSADYLLDERSTIPGGRGFSTYGQRLIIFGKNDIAPGATGEQQIVMVSESGEPESFDSIDNNIILTSMTEGPYEAAEARGMLYFFGRSSTVVTRDNGDTPSVWTVDIVDSTIGVIVDGYSTAAVSRRPHCIPLKYGQPIAFEDNFIVLTNTGIRLFNGTYGDTLSWNISQEFSFAGTGDGMAGAVLSGNYRIHLNTKMKEIYISNINGDTAGAPNQLLYGDFSEGLSSDRIKWSLWDIHGISPVYNFSGTNYYISNLLVYHNGEVHVVTVQESYGLDYDHTYGFVPATYSTTDKRDHKFDGTGILSASVITFSYRLPYVSFVDDQIHQYCGLVVNANTLGTTSPIYLFAWGINDSVPDNVGLYNYPLTVSKNDKFIAYREFNLVTTMLSIQLQSVQTVENAYTNDIDIGSATVYGTALWQRKPA